MPRSEDFILLALYVLISVSGLTLIKMAASYTTPIFMLGVALYGLGFLLWFVVLARFPLSQVFPIAAASLMLGTQFAGWGFLGETLSSKHLMGVGLIALGTTLLVGR